MSAQRPTAEEVTIHFDRDRNCLIARVIFAKKDAFIYESMIDPTKKITLQEILDGLDWEKHRPA